MKNKKVSLANEYVVNHRRHSIWLRIVSVLGCLVVFCTTYALILPALTEEQTVYCGMQEHTHTDACLESTEVQELICEIAETEGHAHDDSCYLPAHTHSEDCYTQKLICGQEEAEPHTHTDECYAAGEKTLTCGLEESDAHTHTDDCYTVGKDVLVCTIEETEGHEHTNECYESVLNCGLEERSEPELICTLAETDGHTHNEGCYSVVETTTCTLNEHTHSLICYSDPSADLETAEDWEKTLSGTALTGSWPADLLAVAKTQLGYTESTANYQVENETEIKGYSRYGQWAGDPYGDWNIYFAQFCLQYAEVPEEAFPRAGVKTAAQWIEALADMDLYYAVSDGYEPKAGDLAFLDLDDTVTGADAAAVISEVTEESVQLILGDSSTAEETDQVRQLTLYRSDPDLLGFGEVFDNAALISLDETEDESGNVYKCVLADGTVFEITLPSALEEGVVLTVDEITDGSSFTSIENEKLLNAYKEIYGKKYYQIRFFDGSDNLISVDISGTVQIKIKYPNNVLPEKLVAENSEIYSYYYTDYASEVSSVSLTEESAEILLKIDLMSLSQSQFSIDIVSASKYIEIDNEKLSFYLNEQKDAFISDSAYSKYYNTNSPLGTAGSFHIVAFGTATLKSHTNGNILAKNLYASSNFGTNTKNVAIDEVSYVQNYLEVNSNSEADVEDVLVVGDANMVSIADNGNALAVNGTKLDKPHTVIQDANTSTAPFIDLARVEREIRSISSYLASFDTANLTVDLNSNNGTIKLSSPNDVGVYNTTASAVSGNNGNQWHIDGFSASGTGAVVINVDCTGWNSASVITLPKALVVVDDKEQSVTETVEFSAGKVVWNFINAEGLKIETNIMTGMVVAPGATVEIKANLNGTVVAENVIVSAESHRTDFTGQIIPTESDAVTIQKVNKDNYAITLSGTTFELYKWDSSLSTFTTMGQYVTDTNGQIILKDLAADTAYKLEEVASAPGYQMSSDAIYFFVSGDTTVSKPSSGPTEDPDTGETITYKTLTNGSLFYVTNTKDTTWTFGSLEVTKMWVSASDSESIPDKVQVKLMRQQIDGQGNAVADTQVLVDQYWILASQQWKLTIQDLPLYSDADNSVRYTYWVEEVLAENSDWEATYNDSDDFADSVRVIGITNISKDVEDSAEIQVTKKWQDSDDQEIEPPVNSVTFKIMQSIDGGGSWTDTGETIVVSAANNWSGSVSGLPVKDGENVIQYTLQETTLGNWRYALSETTFQNGKVTTYSFTATNTYTVEYTEIEVNKKWLDASKEDISSSISTGIEIELRRYVESQNDDNETVLVEDTEFSETITLNSSNSWSHTFENLETCDAYGNVYSYYVTEVTEVPNFTVSYENNKGIQKGTITITNTQTDTPVELPNTGGSGTAPYLVTGLALLSGAGGLLYRKRKRGEGDCSN